MKLVDIDDNVLAFAWQCLSSSELCRLHIACKSLKTCFESCDSGLPEWIAFIQWENSQVKGSLSSECIWLQTLLGKQSIAFVAKGIRCMNNPIRNALQFQDSSEVECFAQAIMNADPLKDFAIPWTFSPSKTVNDQSSRLLASKPVNFSCGAVRFQVSLCAMRTSLGRIQFFCRPVFTGFMLMEEADMISIHIGASIITPFEELSIPMMEISINSIDDKFDLPDRSSSTTATDQGADWAYARLLSGVPLTSMLSVDCLLSGMSVEVKQNPSDAFSR